MWTLNEALELIRRLQPGANAANFHIALGGSVLNNGQSSKDLDLYFLPLEDESNHPDDYKITEIANIMSMMFGYSGNYGQEMGESYEGLRTSYRQKLTYNTRDNRRIDIFIV